MGPKSCLPGSDFEHLKVNHLIRSILVLQIKRQEDVLWAPETNSFAMHLGWSVIIHPALFTGFVGPGPRRFTSGRGYWITLPGEGWDCSTKNTSGIWHSTFARLALASLTENSTKDGAFFAFCICMYRLYNVWFPSIMTDNVYIYIYAWSIDDWAHTQDAMIKN